MKSRLLLTDPLSTGQGGSGGVAHDVRRYIVGRTGELHLPFGLSFEVDTLYRPLNYTEYPVNFTGFPVVNLPAAHAGSDWQFPFLAKYEFHKGFIVHPSVDGGVTYRHVSFSNVSLANANTAGVSVGGGLNFKLLLVRLSP